jgi:hypothetical protein
MLPAQAIGISLSLHWGFPFLVPFHPNILLDGLPALILLSMTKPHIPPESPVAYPAPDFIVFGLPNVLFNGIPAIPEFALAYHPGGSFSCALLGCLDILLGF